MSVGLKYSLGRLGLFVGVWLLTLPLPIPMLLKLMIALLVSAPLSFVLLRRWRLGFSEQLDARGRERGAQKARLRASLRGDD